VYEGPPVVTKIKQELSELLAEDGYNSISDLIGHFGHVRVAKEGVGKMIKPNAERKTGLFHTNVSPKNEKFKPTGRYVISFLPLKINSATQICVRHHEDHLQECQRAEGAA
jgi:hypothetical protein